MHILFIPRIPVRKKLIIKLTPVSIYLPAGKRGFLMTDVQTSDIRITARLMFRLLPVQILLSAIGSVNGIVSGYFASNYVGVQAMSAVGLYGPVGMLITSFSTVLVSGTAILCGKYMGQNDQEKLQNIFSLSLFVSLLSAVIYS